MEFPHTPFCYNSQRRGRAVFASLLSLVLLAGFSGGCGYHQAGKATKLPPNIRTIAIPTFSNNTTYFKVEQRLTHALIEEFIARTRYRVVSSEEGADAVISGRVLSVGATPVIFDPSGRATTFLVSVGISVTMADPKRRRPTIRTRTFLSVKSTKSAAIPHSSFRRTALRWIASPGNSPKPWSAPFWKTFSQP